MSTSVYFVGYCEELGTYVGAWTVSGYNAWFSSRKEALAFAAEQHQDTGTEAFVSYIPE